MAGYSKENERQNKALKSILRGESPEERVMVGYEGVKDEKTGDKIDRLSDIMKEARMPWFCPECDKVMKKRLDNKMWIYYGHCFDCQIDIENKMRIEGTYDKWSEEKIKNNKITWIREQRESIEEFKKQKTPSFFNAVNPDGYSVEKEKWATDFVKIEEQANEALEYLNKLEESIS